MKLIEMYLSHFVPLQVVQPPLTFYSTSCWFALQIAIMHKAKVEGKGEKEKVQRQISDIQYIIDCTHENLNVSLYAVEAKVNMTPLASWGDTADIINNDGFPLVEETVFVLFKYLRKSFEKVIRIVTEIGQYYSVEIPSAGFLTPSMASFKPRIGE